MLSYRCDGCGIEMAEKALRYKVRVDIRAAYHDIEVSLADLVKDHRAEILALIEQMGERDAREVEEEIYKKFDLDLCPKCHKAYLKDPLRFDPDRVPGSISSQVDAFLQSLGYGETKEDT